MKYAGFWRQVFSAIIDQAVVWLPSVLIPQAYFYLAVAQGMTLAQATYYQNMMFLALLSGLSIFYYVFFNGRYGVTLGRRLLGLKLVRLDQPNRDGIGYLRALVRLALFAVAVVFVGMLSRPVILGVIVNIAAGATIVWMLIDDRRRTIEDLLTGTFMVYDPADKFPDFDPDKLVPAHVRPLSFGAVVILNAIATLYVVLHK